jgi:hypothetical protein
MSALGAQNSWICNIAIAMSVIALAAPLTITNGVDVYHAVLVTHIIKPLRYTAVKHVETGSDLDPSIRLQLVPRQQAVG